MNDPTRPAPGLAEEAAPFAALDELDVVPGSAAERAALARYVDLVRGRYGDRLVDVVLFGSRARGDATPESDADVAVVLKDGAWNFWTEKIELADLSYDILVDEGLRIGPWVVSASQWREPTLYANAELTAGMKRSGRSLMAAP